MILNSCNSAESADLYEYVSSQTANHCLNLIINGEKEDKEEEDAEEKKNEAKKQAKNSSQTILHTLTLLKHIIHHFQANKLKSVGECLLRLMTLKDIVISVFYFKFILYFEFIHVNLIDYNIKLLSNIASAIQLAS